MEIDIEDYDVFSDLESVNGVPEPFRKNTFWSNILKLACSVLAGSGVFLNIVIVLSTYKPSMKTSLKLVVSLAMADMLIAAFHLVFAFIDVLSPWSRTDVARFKLQNNADYILGNATDLSKIFSITGGILPLPTGILGSLFPTFPNEEGDMLSNNGTEKTTNGLFKSVSKSTNLTQLKNHIQSTNELTSNVKITDGLQELLSEFFSESSKVTKVLPDFNLSSFSLTEISGSSYQTTLQAFLSAFYFMPNIAGVLSMLAITTCLLITIINPLKHHMILSKRRGTILVLVIWSISAVVSSTLFTLIRKDIAQDKYSMSSYPYISTAHVVLWVVTLLIFVTIAIMYVIIVCQVTRSKLQTAWKNQRTKTNIRATATALAITGSYGLFYLPFIWIELLHAVVGNRYHMGNIFWYGLMQLLFVLNTNVDPIIYSLRLTEVKNGFKSRLGKALCR